MIWTKGLGVFNIIWALILFFLFLGSQFGFICGALLGIFYIISGMGVLNRDEKKRKLFLRVAIPLSLLAVLNLIPFTNPKMPQGFRMNFADVMQFTGIFIVFPLAINFIILPRPKVKEEFK